MASDEEDPVGDKDKYEDGDDEGFTNTQRTLRRGRSRINRTTIKNIKSKKEIDIRAVANYVKDNVKNIANPGPSGAPMVSDNNVQVNTDMLVESPVNVTRIKNNNMYRESDPGPFYVYVDNIKRNRLHPMSIGKSIYNSNFQYKNAIIEIKQIGYARVRIQTNNFTAANLIKNLNIINENDVEAYIPGYMTHRQGIIRNVDVSESDEDLLAAMRCNVKVINVRRMIKKVLVNGETQMKKLGTCVVQFEGQQLPEHVYIWSTRCTVTPYVYPVIQCFKCLRIGHLSKQCKGVQRCKNCGENHDIETCSSENKIYCVLCKSNNHNSTNRQCPEYKKAIEIKRSMAYNGTSFEDSKEAVETYNSYADVLNNDAKNTAFPKLIQDTRRHIKPTQNYQRTPKHTTSNQVSNNSPPRELFYNFVSERTAPVFASKNDENSQVKLNNEIKELIINTVHDIILHIIPKENIPVSVHDKIKNMVSDKLNINKNQHGYQHPSVEREVTLSK